VIRVLIAANSAVARAGLESLLNSSAALTIAGAASGDDLASRIEELQPDVVLLELDSQLEATLATILAVPQSPVIVALGGDQPAELLRSGAGAVLPRTATASEIVAAIEAAAAGLLVMHPETLDGLLQPSHAGSAASRTLTPREIEVLRMLAEGLGNKTIAFRLGISEHTVKFHLASIFSKLSASSRTEAVTLGVRQGLIML
jgi:NarL family two-component system response regulator YdfI